MFIPYLLLLSRFLSEIIYTYFWDKANYVWAVCLLICLVFYSSLFLTSEINKKKTIFTQYWVIFFYLIYLFFRLDFNDIYSLKCYLCELIVFIIFIYFTGYNDIIKSKIEFLISNIVKINIIIALFQILFKIISDKIYYPFDIYNARPVEGIFSHPNIYIVVILPFIFYFIIRRNYIWIFLLFITCLFTGTRSPFIALICLSNICIKSFLNKKIKWIDIFISISSYLLIFSYLVIKYYPEISDINIEESRLDAATFQWRLWFWNNFLIFKYDFTTFFGHGVGSADKFAAILTDKPLSYPHSDYIRIFYDIGLIGLIIFINVIFFILKLIKNNLSRNNDFILMLYIMIFLFYLTDNYIYQTHAIFQYCFIAVFLSGTILNAKSNTSSNAGDLKLQTAQIGLKKH